MFGHNSFFLLKHAEVYTVDPRQLKLDGTEKKLPRYLKVPHIEVKIYSSWDFQLTLTYPGYPRQRYSRFWSSTVLGERFIMIRLFVVTMNLKVHLAKVTNRKLETTAWFITLIVKARHLKLIPEVRLCAWPWASYKFNHYHSCVLEIWCIAWSLRFTLHYIIPIWKRYLEYSPVTLTFYLMN